MAYAIHLLGLDLIWNCIRNIFISFLFDRFCLPLSSCAYGFLHLEVFDPTPMKKLLLDGYNVVHQIPEIEKKISQNLEAARNTLIEICFNLSRKRADIEKLIIVFDSKRSPLDFYPVQPSISKVAIIFSEPNQSADDKILEILQDASQPRSFVVVSNDTYIINNVRAYGAKIISVQEFEKFFQKPALKTKSFEISKGQAQQITEEYKNYLGIID